MRSAGQRPDPEVQAGQALRRLRLARNWSQDEVAARMTAYGYDFHQTMIAKIEAAQRPLRVRELADFAALYGVEVQDLVYPPTGSLPETDEEISEVTAKLHTVQARADEVLLELEDARETERRLHSSYRASAAETAVLEGRLASLKATRQKLINWESGKEHSRADADRGTKPAMPESKGSTAGSAAGDPTVIRILLGIQLRRLREARQITPETAGYAIRASRAKISRMESGRVSVKESDIADLLTLYGVTDKDERRAIIGLAYQASRPGWWNKYSDILPPWFESYIGLESASDQIRVYEAQYIPGLLQTEDYARAITLQGNGDKSPTDIDRRVKLRISRQALLDHPGPPSLQVVLDEAVLRRNVGGQAVMRDQVQHLTEIAEHPNVTIQIIPFQATDNPPGGSFTILSFPQREVPDIVYIEQLTSALYLEGHKEVSEYLKLMERLTAEALRPSDTTYFLTDRADQLT